MSGLEFLARPGSCRLSEFPKRQDSYWLPKAPFKSSHKYQALDHARSPAEQPHGRWSVAAIPDVPPVSRSDSLRPEAGRAAA
eukprot:2748762-Heterocapsa_arctica.AAC.1